MTSVIKRVPWDESSVKAETLEEKEQRYKNWCLSYQERHNQRIKSVQSFVDRTWRNWFIITQFYKPKQANYSKAI